MALTVINRVGIFGQIIGGIYLASFEGVIQAILDGKIKENPPFTFGVVDCEMLQTSISKRCFYPQQLGNVFLRLQKALSVFMTSQN